MDKSYLLELYQKMVLIRDFDKMCIELKLKDLIMDGFHPYGGEEACAVGVTGSMKKQDILISTHRPQGHGLAKGVSVRALLAEMLGRRGGVCEGIGGPMQWVDLENNFFCGSIVGSGMTQACGVALALKKAGDGRVVVCFFGDGASNTGSFHEAMNLAAIWKLPVVYICENNQYAEAMPVNEFVSAKPISIRGKSYGIDGVSVDGNNVEAVYEVASDAIQKARTGVGPYFIECVTYRILGHYIGDPESTYRSKAEVEEWKTKDPILNTRKALEKMGISEDDFSKVDGEVKTVLEDAKTWGLAQRFPTIEEATSNLIIPLN
jgi:TPP-dependent pyruvate/acetoin dehydrogenase alpha subunit